MRDLLSITNEYHTRKTALLDAHTAANEIINLYDGKIQVALPELDKNERPQVANLIQSGIDQHAMRIASVSPFCDFPPTRTGKEAADRARDRRNTVYGWWAKNRMDLLLPRRARDLIACATAPVVIRPPVDARSDRVDRQIPRWHVRSPVATYPAPGLNPDELLPDDCIFSFRRSFKWLTEHYDLAGLQTKRDTTPATLFDCLEYIDSESIVLIVLGQREPYDTPSDRGDLEVSRIPNRAERPLAVVPGRITLGRLAGQFDQMIGMYLASAKLWGLHLHGVARAIFGETWLSANPGETPNIVQEADPIEGIPGIVEGGALQNIRPDPGFQTIPALSMLERNQRITSAVPAEFGGEGASNVRTARRGGQVLSAAVDFPVQEHQRILAASLEEENRAAIAIAKAYSGNIRVSFHVPGARQRLTYTADAIFGETDDHTVSYAYPGADTNSLVIEGGQRVGMETMSHRSFMEIDPMVKDPELEMDRIVAEKLQAAGLNSIMAQASDPMGPYSPEDMARIAELVLSDKVEWWEAIKVLNDEKKAAQAAAAQGQLSPEQMQPGLAPIGAPGGAENYTPVPGLGPGPGDLTSLLGSLRLPTLTVPSERGG